MSAQTSVQYALDIANALVFLRMQGYVHTGLNSTSIMVTSHDAAKLADLGPCTKVPVKQDQRKKTKKEYGVYADEPQYTNIEGIFHHNILSGCFYPRYSVLAVVLL